MMKTTFLSCILSTAAFLSVKAQIPCDPSGNIIIYSNYDGGFLNINVDDNIPNLKIGIVSYEPTQVTLSGTYVGNITEVQLVSYYPSAPGNMHCSNTITSSGVSGVNPNIVSVVGLQPATLNDPNGYGFIICAYDCTNANTGGCNTAQQIEHYFMTEFSGNYRRHYTQYGCWCGTYDISQALSCCGAPVSSGNAPPVITPPNPTICQGGSVTLTASGYSSYNWSPGTGLSQTTGSTVVASPSNTTTYTVTANGSCGIASGQVTVTVAPPATVTIPISPAADTICAGDTISLTASGFNTFNWSPPTGLSSVTGTTVQAFPTSTTTYTVTTNAPCTTATGSVTIVVNPVTTLPLTITPPGDTICVGQSTTLQASGNFTNYSWSPATGLNQTTGNTVTASPSSSITYTVTGSGNCNTGTAQTTVTVGGPPPVAGFTYNPNGLTLNFTNTSTNSLSYNWNFGDQGTSTVNNPSHTYTIAGTYTITLIVTNACGSDTFSTVVTVAPHTGVEENGSMISVPVYLNGHIISTISVPAGEALQFAGLWDMNGRMVSVEDAQASAEAVQLRHHLSSGLYVLRLQDAKGNMYQVKIDATVKN